MSTVYKYEIPIVDVFVLDVPRGAEILHVAEQNGVARLWALVDPTAPAETRMFRLAGTGHNINQAVAGRHVGSFLMHQEALVFHLFEITPQA